MKIYRDRDRGEADFGWLKARYSFSFAGYYNPSMTHFGTLRVLNDDIIAPGQGFGTHPHENMEIITIPLSGKLAHKDSMGNEGMIHDGEIQVMSAGTGIQHSEFNGSSEKEINLLQIWIFPAEKGLKPRYGQKSIGDLSRKNGLYEIISPDKNGDTLWINNDVWFNMGEYTEPAREVYKLRKEENGIYLFVIEGEVDLNGEKLERRDAAGITGAHGIEIDTHPGTRLLIMDIPMII